MKDIDYQAIVELKNSHGWKIITERLQKRIKDIEDVLLLPTNDDMLGKNELENIRLLNYKKAERVYLLWLINEPDTILKTKINLDSNKKTV